MKIAQIFGKHISLYVLHSTRTNENVEVNIGFNNDYSTILVPFITLSLIFYTVVEYVKLFVFIKI